MSKIKIGVKNQKSKSRKNNRYPHFQLDWDEDFDFKNHNDDFNEILFDLETLQMNLKNDTNDKRDGQATCNFLMNFQVDQNFDF